jgi:hypothetical protein
LVVHALEHGEIAVRASLRDSREANAFFDVGSGVGIDQFRAADKLYSVLNLGGKFHSLSVPGMFNYQSIFKELIFSRHYR